MNFKYFYQNNNLNGQSQCYGCRQNNVYNVNWSCMMYVSKINGHHYCEECAKKIETEQSKLKRGQASIQKVKFSLVYQEELRIMENTNKSVEEMSTKELKEEILITEKRIKHLEKTGAPERIIKEEKEYRKFLNAYVGIQGLLKLIQEMLKNSCKNK